MADDSWDVYRQVLPDFAIERELGVGGFGVVLLGQQVNLGRTVAVKFLRSSEVDSTALRRFKREAHAYSQMSHPNLVKIYNAQMDGPAPYIIMEYVEGADLKSRIKAGQTLPVASIGAGLARALEYIHKRGILHRDIKPANILLRPDGQPVLMDFGLVKDTSADTTALTSEGQCVGTAVYMAPEVLLGESCGSASDVYALALVLYEVACRRTMFAIKDSGITLAMRIRSKIPSLRDQRVDIAPPLDELLSECFSTDPRKRPPAGEVAARLERLARGATHSTESSRIMAHRSVLHPAAHRTPAYSRPLAPVLLVAGVLLAAGLFYSWHRSATTSPANPASPALLTIEPTLKVERDRTAVVFRTDHEVAPVLSWQEAGQSITRSLPPGRDHEVQVGGPGFERASGLRCAWPGGELDLDSAAESVAKALMAELREDRLTASLKRKHAPPSGPSAKGTPAAGRTEALDARVRDTLGRSMPLVRDWLERHRENPVTFPLRSAIQRWEWLDALAAAADPQITRRFAACLPERDLQRGGGGTEPFSSAWLKHRETRKDLIPTGTDLWIGNGQFKAFVAGRSSVGRTEGWTWVAFGEHLAAYKKEHPLDAFDQAVQGKPAVDADEVTDVDVSIPIEVLHGTRRAAVIINAGFEGTDATIRVSLNEGLEVSFFGPGAGDHRREIPLAALHAGPNRLRYSFASLPGLSASSGVWVWTLRLALELE